MKRYSTTKYFKGGAVFMLPIIFSLAHASSAQEVGYNLFDNSRLIEIRIESDSIRDLWSAINRNNVMVGLRIKAGGSSDFQFTTNINPVDQTNIRYHLSMHQII